MNEIKYEDIVKEFKDYLTKEHTKALELYNKKDKDTRVDIEVCEKHYYSEEVDYLDVYSYIDKNNKIAEEEKNYNGLMEIKTLDYYPEGYCDDGEFILDYLGVEINLTYYIPLKNDKFQKLFDEKTYKYSKLLKKFITNKLYSEIKKKNENKHKRFVECNLLELFKNDLLSYSSLIKAVYSNCKI
jgi:hypothetical protein